MVSERKLWKSLGVVATLVLYVFMVQSAAAAHGGGGHGGGGHGGGFHGGGHGGGHSQHAYRPSNHHAAHHDNHGDHRGDHRDHHHDGWHHGGWGPGYEGGWGPVYGGWNGGWGYGGETVVNNIDDSSDDGDSGSDSGDVASDDGGNGNNQQTAANNSDAPSFPTDNWPELGLVTYSGEYGGSDGQVIMRVIPNSAAAKAGLVPGDVILTFNGAPVPNADELDQALTSANGQFQAEVWDSRTGRKSTLTGTYNPAPATPPTKTTAFTPAPAK